MNFSGPFKNVHYIQSLLYLN